MAHEKSIVLVDGQAPPPFVPSKRFTLALLVFFAFIVQYSQRVNLPIAIVCMVNRMKIVEQPFLLNGTTHVAKSLEHDVSQTVSNQLTHSKPSSPAIEKGGFFEEKQFIWTESQQQILLGGYWAGYIFTQVPGKFAFIFHSNQIRNRTR
jgi:hypothetical protein